MVNDAFIEHFTKHATKSLGNRIAGPPTVYKGGVEVDHYKGIANSLATNLIPLFSSKYEATEFIYGWIPLAQGAPTQLFFQVPALNVKGRNIPGIGQFAAVYPGTVPETIVAPKVGMKCTFMPLQAVGERGGDVRMAQMVSAQWPPMVQALNADKKARKAAWPRKTDSRVAAFYLRLGKTSPLGLTQLAPFKGNTIFTAQRVPIPTGFDNRPFFDYWAVLNGFGTIASAVARHSTPGDAVGQQVKLPANAAMMSLALKHAEAASGPR